MSQKVSLCGLHEGCVVCSVLCKIELNKLHGKDHEVLATFSCISQSYREWELKTQHFKSNSMELSLRFWELNYFEFSNLKIAIWCCRNGSNNYSALKTDIGDLGK